MDDPANLVVELYRRHARVWAAARKAGPGTEQGWLNRFADLLPPQASLLDIGCGSGEPVARFLVSRGHKVHGVDASQDMVALFRANLPGERADVLDMRTLKLGRAFDGLIAWDSFFHLPPAGQRQMFPIFRDHAASGAPLLFTSGPAAGEAIGLLEGEPLYHASLDPDEYRALLAENGFALVTHVAEDPDCGGHTVWLARKGQVFSV